MIPSLTSWMWSKADRCACPLVFRCFQLMTMTVVCNCPKNIYYLLFHYFFLLLLRKCKWRKINAEWISLNGLWDQTLSIKRSEHDEDDQYDAHRNDEKSRGVRPRGRRRRQKRGRQRLRWRMRPDKGGRVAPPPPELSCKN